MSGNLILPVAHFNLLSETKLKCLVSKCSKQVMSTTMLTARKIM